MTTMDRHVPRKRFGQHFLHDRAVIDRILCAANPQPGDRFVEIGPGLGALTQPLLQRLGSLDVVEFDRDVIPELRTYCAGSGDLKIHQADALRFDYTGLALSTPSLRLIGNLPYNISTPLLFLLLDLPKCIKDMHFMLQKEVADRVSAVPGSKQYGRLSVTVAARANAEALFDVRPGAFYPLPKVISTFVRLTPRAPDFMVARPMDFDRVVSAAFAQRRKMLSNALRGTVSIWQMECAGIDPKMRAEQLSPADFARLAAQLGTSD